MVMSTEIKSFQDLMTDVQRIGFCGKCGGCFSFCSADNLGALEIGQDGFPVLADQEKCLRCGICYAICPNTHELDNELREKSEWKPPIGSVKDLISAQTTNLIVGEKCTDGGVVTSLLIYLLDSHLIDAALVSRSDGPFHRAPLLATTGEEIISSAGSHFDESYHVGELGSLYSTYSPAMFELRKLRKGLITRVAMVGTPCQINTVRKMQVLKVIPSDVIKFCFGLFCWENFSFNDPQLKRLGEKHGFDATQVVKINVKEDFLVYLGNGTVVHIPFEDMESIARPACLVCPDFSAEYADISFGGLGSPDGYTTVLIRSEKGKWIYKGALAAGYIKEKKFPSVQRARSEWMEINSKILNFSDRKKNRALRNRKAAATKMFGISTIQ